MPRSWVYFIRCPANGFIKIGITAHHPDFRLRTLRTGSPVELEPMAVIRGDRFDENKLHILFHAFRQHGEWFSPDEKLLAYIAKRGRPWPEGGPKFPTPEEVQLEGEERIKRFWRDAIEFLSFDLVTWSKARAAAVLEGRDFDFDPIIK